MRVIINDIGLVIITYGITANLIQSNTTFHDRLYLEMMRLCEMNRCEFTFLLEQTII